MRTSNKNITLLTMPEIASWQIPHPPAQFNPDYVADLPALQRGAVWKVRQIEELWDSIFQGFPIGAFMLSPHDPKLGFQPHELQTTAALNARASRKPTHLLLDGQQRATGIALAFLDPWKRDVKADEIKSVLWVDLEPPAHTRDVHFVFRVLTCAHPWGYLCSDPDTRISERQIRLSMRAFKEANPQLAADTKPHQMPLTGVWPWDAQAPVPVAILIDALTQANDGALNEAKAIAWKRVQLLPFMQIICKSSSEPMSEEAEHWWDQKQRVQNAFTDSNSEAAQHLEKVLGLLKRRMADYVIPIMNVPISALRVVDETPSQQQQSPVETLFIRINSAGTPLAGEELMYSLIKSAWIEAPDAIGKLTHRLASSARIALLASRVVRARHQHNKVSTTERLRLISTPTVEEFRRLMHGQNAEHPKFWDDFQFFIKNDGLQIFREAHVFLTEGGYALPPVVASELAQRSPDVFFLFLYWLERLGIARDQITEANRRRVLGFLTALAWFATSDGRIRAVDAIWDDLQRVDDKALLSFFDRNRFAKTFQLDDQGKRHMVPLLSPKVLTQALKTIILGQTGCSDTITKANSAIWKEWKWRQWLVDEKLPNQIRRALTPLFQNEKSKFQDGETVSDQVRDSWSRFLNSIRGNRSMLLYAQRDWLATWFPDFDPSQPEFLEDKNRPWDYDHIHPQSYLQGKHGGTLQGVPQLIKDWNNSIGNLRAWPLEANRSLGDCDPRQKLENVIPEEKWYGIKNGTAVRTASFIAEADWTRYWPNCVPEEGNLTQANSHAQRKALINAIVSRFLAIYRHWYEALKLSTLS